MLDYVTIIYSFRTSTSVLWYILPVSCDTSLPLKVFLITTKQQREREEKKRRLSTLRSWMQRCFPRTVCILCHFAIWPFIYRIIYTAWLWYKTVVCVCIVKCKWHLTLRFNSCRKTSYTRTTVFDCEAFFIRYLVSLLASCNQWMNVSITFH